MSDGGAYVTPSVAVRNNVDLLVDKILDDNTPIERVKAYAEVIRALGGHGPVIPNEVPEDTNSGELRADQPIDFSEVEGVEVQGVAGKRNIRIYKTPQPNG